MARLYTNNASTTLASNIASGATSLDVAAGDGALFPTPTGGDTFTVTIEQGSTREIVEVTARSTDTFTVTRAQEGTSASAFTAGATIELRITAASATAWETGGGGDAFTTIAVSGQSNIVADSSTDTLTVAAGTGITLTTDASTDTLTIASSADLTYSGGLLATAAGTWAPMITPVIATPGGGQLNINNLYLSPFIVSETFDVDRLGCYLSVVDSTNADAVIRFGLWEHDATNHRPGTLIVDGGTVSTYSGSPRWVDVTFSAETLTPGIYWVGAAKQGTGNTATTGVWTTSTGHRPPIKQTTAPANTNVQTRAGVQYLSATGAFASITTNPYDYTTSSYQIWYRVG